MSRNVDQLLSHVQKALNSYRQHIESGFDDVSLENRRDEKLVLATQNLLEDTRKTLEQELSQGRIAKVNSTTLKAIENTVDHLLESKMENRVNAIHFAIYGHLVPFWTTLRAIQQMLHTIEALKRGRRVASIDEMEGEKDED